MGSEERNTEANWRENHRLIAVILVSRPIIGITNTYSSFNPCHSNVPNLIDALKRGVLGAGGLPIVLHPPSSNPSTPRL